MNNDKKGTSIRDQTLQEWKRMMFDGYTRNEGSWRVVGDWLYPSRDNSLYSRSDVAYHVCKANYDVLRGEETIGRDNGSISPIEEGCARCGMLIPDGIKMIMLLGKL